MFTKTLSQNASAALALLGKSNILKDAYLAGGTACALQLGHRVSLDLDFFTEKEFTTDIALRQLEQLPGQDLRSPYDFSFRFWTRFRTSRNKCGQNDI